MGTSLIPSLGASGLYTVSEPFNTVIEATNTYECMAVRYLAELINLGIDPYSKYYEPQSVSSSNYQADLTAGNVAIVSLMDSGGEYFYIPSTYITAYPNSNGIPYTPMILGIDLGALPNYQDLSSLKTKLISVILANLGITTTITEIAVGKTQNLDQSDHNALQAARTANITDDTTDLAKYLACQAQLTSTQQQLTALQNYVATTIPPPAPSPPAPPPSP